MSKQLLLDFYVEYNRGLTFSFARIQWLLIMVFLPEATYMQDSHSDGTHSQQRIHWVSSRCNAKSNFELFWVNYSYN